VFPTVQNNRDHAPFAGYSQTVKDPVSSPNFQSAKIGTLAFSTLRPIGQFNLTYLLCENEGSLILIDQHAAHERIGFEKLKNSYLTGSLAAQRMLHPLTFDLSESEAVRLRNSLLDLEKFGFLVDEFGDKTFVLKGTPNLLAGADAVALLRDLVSTEEEAGIGPLQDKLDHVLATMACHRQIRAGDRLQHEEMVSLLQDLEGTPRSYHCPHGRPVMIEIGSREIEKWFKRVV
jgi:DNA mismatch repair protein MutL